MTFCNICLAILSYDCMLLQIKKNTPAPNPVFEQNNVFIEGGVGDIFNFFEENGMLPHSLGKVGELFFLQHFIVPAL